MLNSFQYHLVLSDIVKFITFKSEFVPSCNLQKFLELSAISTDFFGFEVLLHLYHTI